MVKKDDKDVELVSATRDADTVARYAPDDKTKAEAIDTAQKGKQEELLGSQVERQGDSIICREVKGTQPCGTVLSNEDELREHLIHIHQKPIPMVKDANKVTKK